MKMVIIFLMLNLLVNLALKCSKIWCKNMKDHTQIWYKNVVDLVQNCYFKLQKSDLSDVKSNYFAPNLQRFCTKF